MTQGTPTFSAEEAGEIARARYGVEAAVNSLPSYRDQNFRLDPASGRGLVLKIAHASEQREFLYLQHRAMAWVSKTSGAVGIPQVCPTRDGEEVLSVDGVSGTCHLVRLLTWVEGTPWSAAAPASPSRLRDLGRFVGVMDRGLDGFSHPAMHHSNEWDLKQLSGLGNHLGVLAIRERREMLERVLRRFESFVLPRLATLPHGVIHGDVNNDNVLIGDDGGIVGLIDFGDVIHTAIVCEVAIAAAYAMLDRKDPAAVGAEVLAGYHAMRPIQAAERDVVFDLICGRLAMSATFAAHFSSLDPNNPAITANEAWAWAALEKLLDQEREKRRQLVQRLDI